MQTKIYIDSPPPKATSSLLSNLLKMFTNELL